MERAATARDHTNCLNQKCLAYQVDEQTYRTKHSDEQCSCAHHGPHLPTLIFIIERGKIPLLRISQGEEPGSVSLCLEAHEAGGEYVAISHVWSDGMGNPHTNTLPLCQIRRVHQLLDELDRLTGSLELMNKARFTALFRRCRRRISTPFWLDTLCMPVGKDHKDTRAQAITQMKEIYQHAYHVLVLDAELERTSIRNNLMEGFLRVSLSGWMRRLWTLQEGVLASSIHVKFHDRILNLPRAYDDLLNDRSSRTSAHISRLRHCIASGHGTLASDACSFYWHLRSLRATLVEPQERRFIGMRTQFVHSDPQRAKQMKRCVAIMKAFAASAFRTTSRPEDEFVCLASLLGWDTGALARVPVQRRMRLLLEGQDLLPQGLIFLPGPRMKERGWRWAVGRFSGASVGLADVAMNDFTPALRSSEGFTVRYPGLVLPPHGSSEGESKSILISTAYEAGVRGITWWRISRVDDGDLNLQEIVAGSSSRVCVIFYDATGMMVPGVPMAGALVYVWDKLIRRLETDGRTTCTFICLARVEEIRSNTGELTEARCPSSRPAVVEDSAALVRGIWTLE